MPIADKSVWETMDLTSSHIDDGKRRWSGQRQKEFFAGR